VVRLHDPDPQPIRKGRIDRRVEFGYKAQVADKTTASSSTTASSTERLATAPQQARVIARVIRRIGRRAPQAVTADRGYGWNRTPLATIAGACTRCGHGVLAHSLVKIAVLS
jgi:transposase, IS5 family